MNAPTNILPSSLAELYRRQREALLIEHPDIDPVTLADTLEGMSLLPDIIAGLIRAARSLAVEAFGLLVVAAVLLAALAWVVRT